ncbi:Dabb family protein [Variovorax guangxiensis]|uniref:Dabb family protein n=1 Tax=Variovorax guangxiensis TaxID=1775474 RepID=UPI0028583219|nr:Dabb family protein [Variovorax guangxiensis]MDR6860457.1 hypothetical protein [Variovorax guangxiensis]
MIRHVVLLRFKDGIPPDRLAELEQDFAALAGRIDGIRQLEWGVNASPEGLNKGFTHCFLVSFDNEADRDAYLPHAEHQAFVSHLQPSLADVLVVDYAPAAQLRGVAP